MYSTYLGGSGRPREEYFTGDGATAIAVDATGNAYVAGNTTSADFPTVSPFQATNKETALDTRTAFVAKLNSMGSALVYSTYLGGSAAAGAGDNANAIAIDSGGSAYVVGATSATDFPTVAAIQAENHADGLNGGAGNAFVVKFNAAGSALVYSTYLGGSGNDSALAVAVNALGNCFVTGFTQSNDFPLAHAWQAQKSAGAEPDAFLAKFNAVGSALMYSTYLGGSDSVANAIAVDEVGNAYVAGSTSANDFPVVEPLQDTNKGAIHRTNNAFISMFNPTGGTLEFSTYLGGSGSLSVAQPLCVPCRAIYNGDSAAAIAVDNVGNLYVTGSTYSTDFPTVMALQIDNRAADEGASGTAFVAKISTAPLGRPWRFGGGALGWGFIGVLGIAATVRVVRASRR